MIPKKARRLFRTIEKLPEGDTASLLSLVQKASTSNLIRLFDAYDARLDLHESTETAPFSAWEHEIRQAIHGELLKRGIRHVPEWLEEFLPDNWHELLQPKGKKN